MPIRELIEWAGGTAEPVSAYLIGGFFGSWVAAADAERAALLDSELMPFGASLGARTLFILPARVCGIVETARLARYLTYSLRRLSFTQPGGAAASGKSSCRQDWRGERGAPRQPDRM